MGRKCGIGTTISSVRKTYKLALPLIVILEQVEQELRVKYSVIEKGFENFFVSLSLPSRHLVHSFVRII